MGLGGLLGVLVVMMVPTRTLFWDVVLGEALSIVRGVEGLTFHVTVLVASPHSERLVCDIMTVMLVKGLFRFCSGLGFLCEDESVHFWIARLGSFSSFDQVS